MSSVSSLVERLRAGPVYSAWCGLPDPSVAGLLAREGFDAVTLDMQHGAIDLSEVTAAILLVAAAGKPAIARLPVGAFPTASRLLDAGAAAIIAPMVNTVEDAKLFAGLTKYPPMGERSWGPHGAIALTGLGFPEYFKAANGFSLALAMIETREALGLIDDILAVDGLDGVFLGPSDLSIALSNGTSLDPNGAEVDRALDHALARAKAAGKFAGAYAATGERAGALAKRGFQLLTIGSDSGMLRAGAQAALAAARG
ncbi:MAG TPA: aldolase/citrate lyase family protein [Beijerinckiaceae bacterium]|jgi:4-hydroxy-2-oxoheptanedioate aldolase